MPARIALVGFLKKPQKNKGNKKQPSKLRRSRMILYVFTIILLRSS
jgi:hypothetical protein